MPEIQMPPFYPGRYDDPKDTEGHVAEATRTLAGRRVGEWLTFVLDAVSEFETNANNQIEHLDDGDADYSFDPVVAAFASAVAKSAFPEIEAVASVVTETMDALQSAYEKNLASALTAAKARLHSSVTALVQAARERATSAESVIQQKIPDIVEDGMTWVESSSTDPDYVSALCDYVGFPEPTRENTVRPVRQSLENPFFGVYQSVRAQLQRTKGVSGLTDDDMNPAGWERDAVKTQQQLYNEQNEAAWEKAYEGVLPDKSVT